MINLFTEFRHTLRDYGLEWFSRYYSCYRGIVASNQDPMFLGRLKVKCPKVYGDDTFEKWAWPKGVPAGKGMGLFAIPSEGDPIWVSFEGGDTNYPIWEYGWWASGDTPENTNRKTPDNYVFQSPKKQRIEFDDKDEKIIITSADENIIEIDGKTGNITATNKAGFTISLSPDGIMVGKGANNLHDFLNDLFTLFSSTTVMTPIIGPQPFVNIAAYEALKLKIPLFLKSE